MRTARISRVVAMILLVPILLVDPTRSLPGTEGVPPRSAIRENAIVALPPPDPLPTRPATAMALNALLPTATPPTISPAASSPPRLLVRARRGGPFVRAAPDESSRPLSGLYYDTYLPVYGQQTDAAGQLWYQVLLWGVLPGWIRADQTEAGDPPSPTPAPSSPVASSIRPSRSKVFALSAEGITSDWVNLRAAASAADERVDLLGPGTRVTVSAWQTDDEGSVWYQVSVNGESGWVWSGALDLVTPKPSAVTAAGKPIWSAITGKGMWMPAPLLEMANPEAVVEAARALGLTHIYLEVGASGSGFYGRAGVDRLLPPAHRAGLHVIGWVLTGLNDLPADISLCLLVATYRTPDGEQLDGVAPDIEDNLNAADVAAFSQILRARVGPRRLIVGVIFPEGTWIGQHHPVAGILSRSFNALAPMDYWHDARGSFPLDVIDRFVRQSVADIHAATGDPGYPVAVIGQAYDGFARNGAGPESPSGAEVTAALQAARAAGAVGVSLFQWGTTTPGEWSAVHAFGWRE